MIEATDCYKNIWAEFLENRNIIIINLINQHNSWKSNDELEDQNEGFSYKIVRRQRVEEYERKDDSWRMKEHTEYE